VLNTFGVLGVDCDCVSADEFFSRGADSGGDGVSPFAGGWLSAGAGEFVAGSAAADAADSFDFSPCSCAVTGWDAGAGEFTPAECPFCGFHCA